MNNTIMGTNANVKTADSKTVRIAVKDYFPDDNSSVEFFNVSREAYHDLCEYKLLMGACTKEKNGENDVKIDIKKLYPHLCKKSTKVYVTREMYESQTDHVKNRKTVLIKVKDMQKDYIGCPVFMEVTNEICMTLAAFRNEDNAEDKNYTNRCDGLGFDENIRGEMNGIYTNDNTEKIDRYLTVKKAFEQYGEILCRRAIKYLVYGQNTTQIARSEDVSPKSVWESVNKIKAIVRSYGKEYFGLA
ncbi:hypothetical protein [Ruminococcus sp.]|uniref:hypothetical protein n=1 Tax=Ruminococcus sp. TaxID=41978 RepID=UPI0025E9E827|nr:hypothetical protein [Ruminococcus sp.]MBQ8964966.1 hypothetical protein [Ruminococcus sp.]